MNFQKRKKSILQKLTEVGEVEIKELAATMKVAEITIRRDLNRLAADGLLFRTHGGAMKVNPQTPPYPFANKAAINIAAKEAIARRAAAEIKEGDIIFMDCGSTVFHLCPFIKNKKVHIITNSIPIVYELRDSLATINIIGGEYDAERQAIHGKMAEFHIGKYHADKAFLGVDGISPEGMFANSEKEATLTIALAANSTATYLLCDASKIGKASYWKFAGLHLAGTIITDASADACQFLKKAGRTLIHVPRN